MLNVNNNRHIYKLALEQAKIKNLGAHTHHVESSNSQTVTTTVNKSNNICIFTHHRKQNKFVVLLLVIFNACSLG